MKIWATVPVCGIFWSLSQVCRARTDCPMAHILVWEAQAEAASQKRCSPSFSTTFPHPPRSLLSLYPPASKCCPEKMREIVSHQIEKKSAKWSSGLQLLENLASYKNCDWGLTSSEWLTSAWPLSATTLSPSSSWAREPFQRSSWLVTTSLASTSPWR